MTLDELRKSLADLGDKADAKAAEIYKQMQAEKENLDTDTRRQVRKFWAVACVISFLIGFGFNWML